MQDQLGEAFPRYLEAMSERPVSGIRINPLKAEAAEVFEKINVWHELIPWIGNGYYVEETSRFTKHPFYHAGLYYVQEPSAMLPAVWLDVQPEDRVLDLCAAPGGKSTQIAGALGPRGSLYSNDPSASRAKALLKNLELFGVSNAVVSCAQPEELAAVYPEFFDRILVDAPCSGEGMFRKNRDVLNAYREHGPEYFAPIQRSVLEQAALMLKPGGTMVYSTCTFSRMEDEDNVDWFLKTHPDFSVEKMTKLYPQDVRGEGHFVCRLRRGGEWTASPAEERREYTLREYSYLLPAGCRLDSSIHYIRTGLLLGRTRNGRFEPSQAHAMALRPEEQEDPIRFEPEDDRVLRYLKGETIDADDSYEGWRLVCIGRWPLGWVKQSGYRCKNKYYPGWRWT